MDVKAGDLVRLEGDVSWVLVIEADSTHFTTPGGYRWETASVAECEPVIMTAGENE